jgi:hypothetical protein
VRRLSKTARDENLHKSPMFRNCPPDMVHLNEFLQFNVESVERDMSSPQLWTVNALARRARALIDTLLEFGHTSGNAPRRAEIRDMFIDRTTQEPREQYVQSILHNAASPWTVGKRCDICGVAAKSNNYYYWNNFIVSPGCATRLKAVGDMCTFLTRTRALIQVHMPFVMGLEEMTKYHETFERLLDKCNDAMDERGAYQRRQQAKKRKEADSDGSD